MNTPATPARRADDLPDPLTPADCDLRDFAFMPLDVARLRDSDMAAYESPEACWAAVLLWSAAWHQVPAASLPDDDRVLAKAAGYGRVVKEWANVREGALHGWIKCADGRLYHPVVAEKALESWKAKLHHQWKKECDRIRKSNKQREAEGRPLLTLPLEPGCSPDKATTEPKEIPPESAFDSAGNTRGGSGNPLENALKGQGEGHGQGQLTSKTCSSSSQASTEVGGDEDRLTPALPASRNGQIALLLRAQGVQATSQNPIVAVTWAENPLVTDELLNVAIAKAKAAKPGEQIPLRYLARIVETMLAEQAAPPPEPKVPREDWAWKRTPQGIEAKGREIGLFARGTETHADFAKRIQAEIDKRAGRQP